jgi:hypothetical protein
MDFERHEVSMEILGPASDFRPTRLALEQRRDPLTGRGSAAATASAASTTISPRYVRTVPRR